MTKRQKGNKQKSSTSRIREMIRVLRKHEILRGMTPEKLRAVLEDMGPTYVKFGQIMSMRSDILPDSYCVELQKLRAEVRPLPFSEVKRLIEEEYGTSLSKIFSEVDQTPLGSASIAQVYHATLKENGQAVVIKAQRPGIYEMMAQDIKLMRKAAKLLNVVGPASDALDFPAVIEELWTVAQQEMNFLLEEEHIERFTRLNSDIVYVSCPKVIRELTTAKVLVMNQIEGIPIDQVHKLEARGYNMHEIGLKLAENYAKQIFDDAFFHADPHPGNIWISDGKIVWLDLGMVGQLSERDRMLLRNAMKAVAQNDVQELKNIVLTLGQVNGKINHARLYTDLDDMVLKYANLDLGDINLGKLIQELLDLAQVHKISMPASITMLARGTITIEGVVSACCPNVNILQIIITHLSGEVLQDFDFKKECIQNARSLYSIYKKGRNIPVYLADLLNLAIKGQSKINFEIVGSDEPLRKIDLMVNRIITCIITAALLMASSIICTTQMQPRILGIPLIGFLGFLIAFCLCIKLVFDTIFRRKK